MVRFGAVLILVVVAFAGAWTAKYLRPGVTVEELAKAFGEGLIVNAVIVTAFVVIGLLVIGFIEWRNVNRRRKKAADDNRA